MSKAQTLTAPADTAATAAIAAASVIPSAPPFCPPWQKFRSPATNPPGFWTAVGHDVWTGGIVMQLGTTPHGPATPLTRSSLQAGYHWQGYLCSGWHSITIRFQFGPVTLHQNGGTVTGKVYAHLGGPLELPIRERRHFNKSAAVVSKGCVYVTINAYLEDAGTYKLLLGGQLDSEYSCSANPYGEIICSRIEVTHCPPFFQAVGAAQGVAPAELLEAQPPAEGKVALIDIDLAKEPRISLVPGVQNL